MIKSSAIRCHWCLSRGGQQLNRFQPNSSTLTSGLNLTQSEENMQFLDSPLGAYSKRESIFTEYRLKRDAAAEMHIFSCRFWSPKLDFTAMTTV